MKLAPAAAFKRRTTCLMSILILLVGKGWSAVNDNCQQNADCSGTNACCAYTTALATTGGPLEFKCQTKTTTGWTCIPDASQFTTQCPASFPVQCRNDATKYGVCQTQSQYSLNLFGGLVTPALKCTGVSSCTECIKANNKMCYYGPS